MTIIQYFSDIISERRYPSPIIRGGLRALSYLFRAGVRLRHFAYEKKWVTPVRLSVPVISVGNIAVGGTGKTPFVHKLVSLLQDSCKVAVLSRGFASELERSGRVLKVASRGVPLCTPQECGDEPFLLGEQTLADVWVGRDRVECGKKAIAEGAERLILDDGLQHRRLARDVELVMIDAKDPWCGNMFLPRGRLRDFPHRLKEAHFIIATHVEDAACAHALEEKLRLYTQAPLISLKVELLEMEKIQNTKAGVFCGLARPERFIDTLRALNVEIVDSLFLLDHCSPKQEQLECFAQACQKKGADRLYCTVKDSVKLPETWRQVLPIFPVHMHLEIVAGHKDWERLIQRIK